MLTTSEPQEVTSSSMSKDFFLARQPILNRDQQTVAYELLFRSAATGGAGVIDDLSATASLIAHVTELGIEQVVGNMLGMVNVDATVMLSDFIKFLPGPKVVFEILETVKATPEVVARVAELKRAGYRFALDDVVSASEDVQLFMPLVEMVKVDIMGMPQATLVALVDKLRGSGKKLLAEKVETLAEFETCLALGFDYFQGYYFAKPTVMSGKKLAPSELAIVQLLCLIDSDADNSQIEAQIKRDALISINLLRLVNTPAAGTVTHIDTVSQALLVLGRRQLQRWLQILLYATPGKAGQFTSPLLQLAVTRGKLLELIVAKRNPGQRSLADAAFTVGVMSLMDTLFSMPMAELLSTINVADDVREALLSRRGQFGAMLKLLELGEQPDAAGSLLLPTLRRLDITAEELVEFQLVAFEWANKITQGR
ncbi:MAG: EAL and HDOD domain-containing protein [Janthinobacterium lividum]